TLARFEGGDVQRATRATGEVGLVVEDARTLDDSGLGGAVLGLQHSLVAALLVVLPVARLEPGEGIEHSLDVVVVDEVGAMGATPLGEVGCIVLQHTLATGAVDAAPVGAKERGVEHPRASIVAVLEADPLVEVDWCVGMLGHALKLPR